MQVYVARLRKLLGDGLLVTIPPGYVLQIDTEQLDAARFRVLVGEARGEPPASAAERLRAGLGLWRGSPLADFTYESFAQDEIRKLEDLRLGAQEDLFDAELALGRHEEDLAEIEAAVRAHPLRERSQAQLMLALYRCGRQAEALAVYQAAWTRLMDELGLEPGPKLKELEQRILRHDPALTGPVPADTQRPQAREPRASRLPSGRVLLTGAALLLVAGGVLAGLRLHEHSRALRAPPNSVGVIDGKRNALRAVVAGDGTPGGIASGAGAVWVSDTPADAVLRIDPAGRTAERIPVGHGPAGVAVGDGQVWVVNQLDRTVSEVNPAAQKEVDTIQVGNGADSIASGAGSIWVANTTDNSISRIDPGAGRVVATIELGAGVPEGIAVGTDGVWVTSSTGQLLLVDPGRNEVAQAYPIGNGPDGVAVGRGSVWVANSAEGTVSRFDPGTGGVEKIAVGSTPSGVAYGGGAVWVAGGLGGSVFRIDPRTSSVRQIRTGNEPSSVATVGKDAWVTVLPGPASHRGGTLRVVGGNSFGLWSGAATPLDPAVWAGIGQWRMLSLTNDGLVSYRRLGGLAGDVLVPDLATALPTPTDGGRTYTFQIRSGIHYSNGALVEPQDVRRGIERVLTIGNPFIRSFYTGIIGADRCVEGGRRCDLRRGIVIDDVTHTLTFHLRAADPDFLHKLAFAMADAVPSGAPDHASPRPLPATGPYMTESYSGRSWTLVRNPRFHEWSDAAQPDGYPDRIVVRAYADSVREVRAVERGTADVLLSLPSSRVSEFATRYARQLHSDPFAATFGLVMNTRVPPFDHVAVRRALNYAIDRGRVVAFNGGSLTAQPTCQILPPTLAGYRPYCPYTTNPTESGSWTAPDVARAERLVARSGTRGMKVTVYTDSSDSTGKAGPLAVSTLDQLGYRASLKRVGTVFPGRFPDSGARAQIGWFTWLQDHPSPSNFIVPLLSCGAFVPGSQANLNAAEFCDPQIDAQTRRAQSLQTGEPGAAANLWSRIDHELVDQAPWVPLYNPRVLTALSARVGNYQYHPFWQVLLDQLWVR